MTQTTQLRSWALINNTGKDLNISKSKTSNLQPENNISLLLSVFDSLSYLYEKLNRLNYVLTRELIEQSFDQDNGEN
jgi:hypothetical protein